MLISTYPLQGSICVKFIAKTYFYFIRYYRSGLEMVRMANSYYEEGSLENAYVLYLKFMTLFLEKIRKHPQFSSVSTSIKATNQAKLREVLGKAEKLKEQLLSQYKEEYKRCVAERNKRKKVEPHRSNETIRTAAAVDSTTTAKYANFEPVLKIDDISYPSDPSTVQPSAPPPDSNIKPSIPNIDRSKKPDIFNPQFTANGLRIVHVPSRLMLEFENIAQKNTINNVETCGILAGKLAKNEFIITHMIVPKQKGTPDSCTTMNEEEIFDFQDQHNLITIGWIHVFISNRIGGYNIFCFFLDSSYSNRIFIECRFAHTLPISAFNA